MKQADFLSTRGGWRKLRTRASIQDIRKPFRSKRVHDPCPQFLSSHIPRADYVHNASYPNTLG